MTQWSRYDNHWKGVAARDILALVQPKPEVKHVIFTSFDGYTTNIRLDQFDQPDVFLVHEWEGKPLTRAHGGPVRMLVPRLYLWKSAKWLRRDQFTISDHQASGKRAAITTTAIPGPKNAIRDPVPSELTPACRLAYSCHERIDRGVEHRLGQSAGVRVQARHVIAVSQQ